MNKVFSYLTVVAVTFAMTACGGNSDKPIHTGTRSLNDQLVAVTVDGSPYMTDVCDIAFEFNYTEGVANLSFSGITFAPRMPEITFALNNVILSYRDDDLIGFSSVGELVPMDGYTVKNVSGFADFRNKVMKLSMDIVARGNTYSTTILSPVQFSYPQGDDKIEYTYTELLAFVDTKTYSSCNDTYFSFHLPTSDTSGGSVNIHNISFVAAMPRMSELRIPLTSAQISVSATGYNIAADEVIPEFLNGTTWTPMDTRTVTGLSAEVNYETGHYSVEFDCFGLHYTNSGTLYYLK